MSLHALAGHMATKGRGGDSLLVHMTPGEVQALQALAERNGGTLTINPETGQPEANFLKKILPMVAGFALGPAGFGLVSSAMGAGALVGGVTALATGSLSRGLMAGLGAYGGASLGSSLMGASAGTPAANAAALGVEGAATAAGSQAAMLAEQTAGFGAEGLSSLADSARVAVGAAPSKAGMLASGFDAVTKSPEALGNFAKNNWQSGLAAISPMLADQGVQTTTKRPDTGTIRNFTFDPYGQTYASAGNYPASEYKGMAQGGIVALAAGGTSYLDLTKDSTPEQVAAAYKQFTAGAGGDTQANQAAALDFLGNLGVGQDTINKAYSTFQAAPTYTDYTQQNVLDYLRTNKDIDIAAETARLNANPLVVNQAINQLGAGFLDPTATGLGSGSMQYFNAFSDAGIDAKELFAANQALDAAAGKTYSFAGKTGQEGVAALTKAFDTAASFKGFDPQGATQAVKDIEWVKKMDATGNSTADIARLTGLSVNEVAAREAAARAAMNVVKEVVKGGDDVVVGGGGGGDDVVVGGDDVVVGGGGDDRVVCATGFHYDPATKSCVKNVDATQNTTATVTTPTDLFTAPATTLPVGVAGNTGPSQVGGGATINPNGTVTTSPRIPGIPVGGFTGMQNLRDAYTAGGGSLGYVNNAPISMAEFNERFNRQTGDSLAAYKYLMGRGEDGIAPVNPATQQRVGEVARPYREAIMGVPAAEGRPTQRYIYQNGRYVENPNYRPMSYDSKGTRNVGMTSSEVIKGLQGLKDPADDGALFDFVSSNSISEAQLAAALGISIAAARARIAAGKKQKTDAEAATTVVDTPPADVAANGGLMPKRMALGGLGSLAGGGQAGYNLGGYSDGGRLLRGPGDGVSDSIPATIGNKQPARLADGEFVIPARIVSELGNGSTEAGARKLYAMMDRVQKARRKTTGKRRVATNTRADKYLPA
jgi:hypothetical protein